MTEPIKIFQGSSGIDTKLDPSRLRFDSNTGISDLAACVNCDIDDSGRVARRDGMTTTIRTEANWKNLFGCGAYALGTKGDALCVIEPNLEYTAIRNVAAGARMSYTRDTNGIKDVIYYSNGYQNGKIIDKISHTWTVGEYVGATTLKEFSAAPVGHLLEIRNGRMFIAKDNFIWYSEAGTYARFRLSSNYFGFPSRLRMVIAVAGGLWISDEENIYWLGGEVTPALKEMPIQIKKAYYPVIEGTAVKVLGSRVGEGLEGIVAVFVTAKGICIGSSDGQLMNLTERKIDLPFGLSGVGFYRDGEYIVAMD